MDTYLLPATTYEAPPRLVRKHILNTIMEDEFSGNEEENYSEGEAEGMGRGRNQHPSPAPSRESTSPVPSLTSSISSYYRTHRSSGDFDELYDVSDDDSDIAPSVQTSISIHSLSSNEAPLSKAKQNQYPSLVIPSPIYWPTVQKEHTISPPRPPKLPISPAALSMLGHDLPTPSNPPSLNGSLDSDPLAGTSAPITPDMHIHSKSGDIWGQVNAAHRQVGGNKMNRPQLRVRIEDGSGQYHGSSFSPEDCINVHDFAIDAEGDYSDSPMPAMEEDSPDVGVQLPPAALDTLQHLSLEVPEFASPTESEKEMKEVFPPLIRPSSADITPMSQTSDYSLSRLSIPSPGGFFSSLESNARHTWCGNGPLPVSAIPPSSTTAEQFYMCPWNKEPPATVEHVVEVEDNDTDGPPTARQLPPRLVEEVPSPESRSSGEVHQVANITPLSEHDDNYEQAIQENAEKSLDRTSAWLAAQTSYIASLRETYPTSEVGLSTGKALERSSSHTRNDSLEAPIKKAVKFLGSEIAKREHAVVQKPGKGDSIYYHAFKHIKRQSSRVDPFRHRHARSDSLQAARFSLPHEHIAQLQGQFKITNLNRPAPQRPISMMPGKEATSENTAEKEVFARVERERQALEQVSASIWVIEAAKYLSGGRLLNSPAVKSLAKPPSLNDIEGCRIRAFPRVLELGGQPSADWGWHCSREYPNATVYTASTTDTLLFPTIRGPHNHRLHTVPSLCTLPYPNNHFSAISARTLFSHLKIDLNQGLGLNLDEYDLCLQECLRCLKPGGYLEYFLMDSEVVNAGSRGTAVSVEFAFNLKTRGYDPLPTKSFLGRLRRAGFDDIKRAWTFLPMGTPTKDQHPLPETPPPNVSTFENGLENGRRKVEAVQGPVGSTADAASMAGLVGSWAWE
ncbi:MAG: hypothetical protein Q9175_001514, partial [Cornicularia normoerica]